MSKTKGNVIDPLVVTEKYGTDAVRMALLQGAAPGTDIVLTEERMESSRAFANKIWNAARFLFLNGTPASLGPTLNHRARRRPPSKTAGSSAASTPPRETSTAPSNSTAITKLAQVLWQFFWHEFCDWYLELKKLASGELRPHAMAQHPGRVRNRAAPAASRHAVPHRRALAAAATGRAGSPVSIALAPYPQYRPELADPEAEREIGILQEIVTLARTLRTEAKLDPKQQLERHALLAHGALDIAQRHAEAIQKLANVTLAMKSEAAPKAAVIRSTAEFDLVLDVPKSQEDAARKAEGTRAARKEHRQPGAPARRRSLPGQGPAQVVEGMRAKLADYKTKRASCHEDREGCNCGAAIRLQPLQPA